MSAPTKILMTADTVGGVWNFAVELIGALEKEGVQFALATMGAPLSREQRLEIKQLRNVEVCESSFKLEWMENPWRDVAEAGDWLLELEEQFKPDIIHLNCFSHGALPWKAPVLVVGHSCVLSWWQAVKNEKPPAKWEIYELSVRAGLENAQSVIAPTQTMLEALAKFYGPFGNECVIPNGRRIDYVTPGHKERIILTAGRLWDEAKNISALAQIAPELVWPLYVAGECDHPDGGAAEFENVTCLGRLASRSMIAWYRRAGIYVMPAKYEPFGLSILEAALAGCALVLGDIPSLRENWDDAALFANPRKPQEIQEQIERFTRDAALQEEYSRRARERALCFDIDITAGTYLKQYHSLISKTAREEQVCA
jgi:glycogen(starch) synthase